MLGVPADWLTVGVGEAEVVGALLAVATVLGAIVGTVVGVVVVVPALPNSTDSGTFSGANLLLLKALVIATLPVKVKPEVVAPVVLLAVFV